MTLTMLLCAGFAFFTVQISIYLTSWICGGQDYDSESDLTGQILCKCKNVQYKCCLNPQNIILDCSGDNHPC